MSITLQLATTAIHRRSPLAEQYSRMPTSPCTDALRFIFPDRHFLAAGLRSQAATLSWRREGQSRAAVSSRPGATKLVRTMLM